MLGGFGSVANHIGKVTSFLEHLGLALALEGDHTRACLLAAHVDAAMRNLGIQREFTEQTTRTRLNALPNESLTSAERAKLEAYGATMHRGSRSRSPRSKRSRSARKRQHY